MLFLWLGEPFSSLSTFSSFSAIATAVLAIARCGPSGLGHREETSVSGYKVNVVFGVDSLIAIKCLRQSIGKASLAVSEASLQYRRLAQYGVVGEVLSMECS